MGAAGKRREEELLAQIAALEGTVKVMNETSTSLKAKIEALEETVR